MERSRNFCFTLNNYTAEEVEAVKGWDCKYLIFGKEVGESGTPHLQGYVAFANQKTLSALKKYSARAHWEIARGTPKQASEYCEKEGDVFEKGERPLSQEEKGSGEKRRWAEAFDAVKEGRLGDVPKDILCTRLKSIEYAVKRVAESSVSVARLEGERNAFHEWHYGVPGSGKSTYCRSFGDRFDHLGNKWWDGYSYQSYVHMEDVDESAKDYPRQWKLLLGQDPFPVETKGGTLGAIRPKKVRVNANVHPSEIWSGVHLEAILQRVKIYHWPFKYGHPMWSDSHVPHERSGSEASPPAAQCLAASDPLNSRSCLSPPDPAGAKRHAGGGESATPPGGWQTLPDHLIPEEAREPGWHL